MASPWDLGGNDLYIGEYDAGTLTIADGGTVSNTYGVIGWQNGSTGTVEVTGFGSTWDHTQGFFQRPLLQSARRPVKRILTPR